jgi:hypothetical protein
MRASVAVSAGVGEASAEDAEEIGVLGGCNCTCSDEKFEFLDEVLESGSVKDE